MRPSRTTDLLRQRIGAAPAAASPRAALGIARLDTRLGGGIDSTGLHDIYAGSGADASAAATFALLLTLLAGERAMRPTVWVRASRAARSCGTLCADGLVELGADPHAMLLVMPDDDRGVLRAADDIVRHGGARAVVVELHGHAPLYDLTASRRLAMGARTAGVMALVLRIEGAPSPSAAETRWRVAAAPSFPLETGQGEAMAPGHPAFDITLLRHRGGIAGFDARLEWNRDDRQFASLPGDLPADAAGRADQYAA